MKAYYIGLDIGTDSIGWAAADMDYRIMKFRGNAMWGTRLFDESNTAEERRSFRTARRRVMRKRDRLNTLESLFDEEITKKDPSFFKNSKKAIFILKTKVPNAHTRFLTIRITKTLIITGSILRFITLEKILLKTLPNTMSGLFFLRFIIS